MAGQALSAHEESKLKMRKAMADVTLVDEVDNCYKTNSYQTVRLLYSYTQALLLLTVLLPQLWLVASVNTDCTVRRVSIAM
jgi:hypothetical protein